jgi:hypothetical protein
VAVTFQWQGEARQGYIYIYIFENTPPPRGWGKYQPMLFGGKRSRKMGKDHDKMGNDLDKMGSKRVRVK